MAGRIQCETAAACEELAAWQQEFMVEVVTYSVYAVVAVAVAVHIISLFYKRRRAEE